MRLKPERGEEPGAVRGSPERGTPPEAAPITLFTMEEAAAHLRVSRRWLQDFIKAHPFYRLAGRRKVFTAADITALFEAFPRPENYRPPAVDPPPSEAALWAKARTLLKQRKL